MRVKPKDRLPPAADPSQVLAYHAARDTGPSLENPRLDWTAPLGGHWNQAMLSLVTEDLFNEIKKGIYEPDVPRDITISEKDLQDLCVTSLTSTRRRFLALIPRESDDVRATESRAKQDYEHSKSVGRRSKRRRKVRHHAF